MPETITSPSTAELAKNRLYTDCYKYLQADSLVLPTIPDVAIKIRQIINDPNASNTKIARVVQIDPSITARLIQIANSPLYMGRRKIESCPEALTRMGLKAAQDIITALALKAVFNAKLPLIRHKMHELWMHSSYVAAISAVLAHKTPGFDPDRAMLAGLVHDIGIVPIYGYADRQPEIVDNPQHLQQAVTELRAAMGVQIVQKWAFPDDFVDVVNFAEDWHRDSGPQPLYSDIVCISQLHSFIGQVGIGKFPKLDELPAYKKIAAGHLDADLSIHVLDQAKEDIQQIWRMLN